MDLATPRRPVDPPTAADGRTLTERIRRIAAEVAAPNAVDVDARARFPSEAFAALREAGALSAAVPAELSGAGCGMAELADQCAALAQGCGASGMVLAMHHIQVMCLVRHAQGSPYFRDVMRELAERQLLLASVTSEAGVGGDTRTSRCAVIAESDGRIRIDKDATTISYAEQADAMLITARRTPEAASSDQSIVYAPRSALRLRKTADWDPMGMRGTCSPGFQVGFEGHAEQVVPVPYADVSALTMVPTSHILWSSVWTGIAADAVARASAYVRAEARKAPGTVPPMAARLAEVSVELQSMRHHWQSLAREFDRLAGEGGEGLATIGWALKMNNLKIASSEAAPRVVHRALQVIGIQGYRNDSRYAVGRQYRDVLSASLMVANERIASKSATMLLVHKDD